MERRLAHRMPLILLVMPTTLFIPSSGGICYLFLASWHFSHAKQGQSGNDYTIGRQGPSQGNCIQMEWYNMCLFYFINYILHALSVRSLPGENAFSPTAFRWLCLLIPFRAVRRGLSYARAILLAMFCKLR
jgi:hypothetical protein